MDEEYFTLNGQSFFVRTWGDKTLPPLVMLHGFPEYSGAWADLAARLSDRFYCVAPDQRGYGQSWAPPEVEAYKTRHLVSDIADLITQLGRGPVAVLGHDWGSAVAYGLAIGRPDLVSRLVVLNGVHPGPYQRACAAGGAQTDAAQYIHALRAADAEERFGADGFARLFRLFAEGMDFSWMDAARRVEYAAEWARDGRLTGMLNWYRASPIQLGATGERLDVPEVPTDKFRVTMPHLLIWGVGDRALLPEATEGLENWCDELTRVELLDADHWLAHQQPDAIAAQLRDFLL